MRESLLFQGSERVLVLAAHPDDEVLGCGGTIAKHALHNHDVAIVILAEGLTSRSLSRPDGLSTSDLNGLRNTALDANRRLGISDVRFLGLPDNRMDDLNLLDIVKEVEKIKADFRPTIVYTHFPRDLNIDHQITAQAVLTAFRPQPNEPLKFMGFFEVPSSTDYAWQTASHAFYPQVFIDISSTIQKKLDALKVYGSEMREWPHSRSIDAVGHLAATRGASVGRPAAESFMIARLLS